MRRWSACAAAALVLSACGAAARKPADAPSAAPEPPEQTPVTSEPEPPSDVAPTPTITRDGERTTIGTGSPAEEILVVPSGVVWTESGSVWAALEGDVEPRVLSGLADPHGLATDGTTVYWVGAENNERWDIRSDTVSALPAFGSQQQQEALAFGDVLYARSHPNALWRYDGKHVRRVPFRPRENWRLVSGLGAARKRIVVAAMEPQGDPAFFFVRVDPQGRTSTVPSGVMARPGRWAVDAAGDLAFVADDRGTVVVVPTKASKRRTIADGLAVNLLCWCGTDVCTLADGTLRRHHGASATVLATEASGATALACGFDRVAWLMPAGDGASSIVVLDGKTRRG